MKAVSLVCNHRIQRRCISLPRGSGFWWTKDIVSRWGKSVVVAKWDGNETRVEWDYTCGFSFSCMCVYVCACRWSPNLQEWKKWVSAPLRIISHSFGRLIDFSILWIHIMGRIILRKANVSLPLLLNIFRKLTWPTRPRRSKLSYCRRYARPHLW